MGCRPDEQFPILVPEEATGLVPRWVGCGQLWLFPAAPGRAAGGLDGTTGAGDIRFNSCCMLVVTVG